MPAVAKIKWQDYGGVALRQADYAARLDNLDWQLLPKLRRDGYHLVVPEMQAFRSLANALYVRCRIELANGRFDDALVTAKTMFALSRHVGEHPTFVGTLVSLGIASITIEALEEMLQQPGCPNLYWALTDLPQPFLDLRQGLQGERLLLETDLGKVDERVPMTAAQLEKVVDRWHTLMGTSPKYPGPGMREWAAAQAKDEAHVQAARKRLVESGLAEDKVKQFPALQVVLLDGKLSFELARDDSLKLITLPYWQAAPRMDALQVNKKSPFYRLVPTLLKIRWGQARLERQLALLRCVEGLRLYAAEHAGQLPAKLADVPVPLSNDPFTGQPFLYQRQAGVAHLRASPPPGMEKNSATSIHYQVSIEK